MWLKFVLFKCIGYALLHVSLTIQFTNSALISYTVALCFIRKKMCTFVPLGKTVYCKEGFISDLESVLISKDNIKLYSYMYETVGNQILCN